MLKSILATAIVPALTTLTSYGYNATPTMQDDELIIFNILLYVGAVVLLMWLAFKWIDKNNLHVDDKFMTLVRKGIIFFIAFAAVVLLLAVLYIGFIYISGGYNTLAYKTVGVTLFIYAVAYLFQLRPYLDYKASLRQLAAEKAYDQEKREQDEKDNKIVF